MKKTKEQLLEKFAAEAKEIFEKHPILREIRWTQYTPYFNDGSPCVFEVRGFSVNDRDSGDFLVENRKYYTYTPAEEKEIQELTPAAEAASHLHDLFGQKEYRLLFGDHAEIFVTKDSIRVESYDHE